MIAQRAITLTYHVSIGMADRKKLVKSENDLALRKDAPGKAQEVNSNRQEMMKVNDIRLYQLKELYECLNM